MATQRPEALPNGRNVDVWTICPNCKHEYVGLVKLECTAAMWRKCHETDNVLIVHIAVLQLAPLLFYDAAHAVQILSAAVRFFEEAPRGGSVAREALLTLANCLHRNRQFDESINVFRATLPKLTRGDGIDATHHQLNYVECLLARRSEADLAEAERQCRRALSEARQLANATLISRAQEHLGTILIYDPTRLGEALELLEEAAAKNRRVWGPDHGRTLQSEANIASTLINLGRTADAEALYQDMFRRAKPKFPQDHGIMKILEHLREKLRTE